MTRRRAGQTSRRRDPIHPIARCWRGQSSVSPPECRARVLVVQVKARSHRDLVTVFGHAATISAGQWITASDEWVR
jgi:hypothetical protein